MTWNHIVFSPRRVAAAAAVAAVLALLGPEASADPIGYTLGSNLYRIDLGTLEVDPVGPTGGIFTRYLAFHADGTLYGLTVAAPDSLRLASFDLATGAGQVVADLALALEEFSLKGFAGDAGGGLWALGRYEDQPGVYRAAIFAIDAAGGAIGEPVEISGNAFAFYGLAACGDLLVTAGFSGLQAIDPSSGQTSLLFPDVLLIDDMDVGPDGGLWGFYTVPLSGIFHGLSRMDLATGEITGHGVLVGLGGGGLAIAPPAGGPCDRGPLAIPALSPLALVALAVSLAVAALWIVRRRA
jgi:hypothetical protein